MSASSCEFRLCLLGAFRAELDGTALSLPRSKKVLLLLAYLAVRHERDVKREEIAKTFWPDTDPPKALYNLRRELCQLRAVLGAADQALSSTRSTIRLSLKDTTFDLRAFDAAIQSKNPDTLAKAVALYTGPLLEGWGSKPDEAWVIGERNLRQQQYVNALQTLFQHALAVGDGIRAHDCLRRLATANVVEEKAWRTLLQSLLKDENFRAASDLYNDYCRLVPAASVTMQALFKKIELKDRAGNGERVERARRRQALRHGLPPLLTPLIGRDKDLRALRPLLSHRLLVLTGSAGIGKTRLAIHLAHAAAADFRDGAVFVDLSPYTDQESVCQAIHAALGSSQQQQLSGTSPLDALIRHLQAKTLLLTLDNCEHLVEAVSVVMDALLAHCPDVAILATSRVRLPVRGSEHRSVAPLAVPAATPNHSVPKHSVEALQSLSSVRLFVARAQANLTDFALTKENAPAIGELCTLLEGIPLAIELAAARVVLHEPAEILAGLRDRMALLALAAPFGTNPSGTNLSGIIPSATARHGSLCAALQWSYDLLSPATQQVFAALSVFRGSFTRQAAASVCGVPHADEALERLYAASFLTPSASGGKRRFALLLTLREFAAEQLCEDERLALAHRHWTYFANWAGEQETTIPLTSAGQAVMPIGQEEDNLRAALEWELAHETSPRLLACEPLRRLWVQRHSHTVVYTWLNRCAVLPQEVAPAMWILLEKVLGSLATYRNRWEDAQQHLDNSLHLAQQQDDLQGQVNAYAHLACLYEFRGESARAFVTAQKRWRLLKKMGETELDFANLQALSHLARKAGNFRIAAKYLDQALARHQTHKEPLAWAMTQFYLGELARTRRAWDSALSYYEEALTAYTVLEEKWEQINTWNHIGKLWRDQGEFKKATAAYHESMALAEAYGVSPLCYPLDRFIPLMLEMGYPERAATLLGAWKAILEQEQHTDAYAYLAELKAQILEKLSPSTYEAAWEKGRRMDLRAAIAFALKPADLV